MYAQQHQPRINLEMTRLFQDWMATTNVTLAFTTRVPGRLYFVGFNAENTLQTPILDLAGAGPLVADGADALWGGTALHFCKFENVFGPNRYRGQFQRCYLQRIAWTCGPIDISDIALVGAAGPIFVSRRYSCLAAPSATANFKAIWKPPFVSQISPEERCGLTGVAVRDGLPAYVALAAKSDTKEGWKASLADGGLIVDVATGETVVGGLSLPHAPRCHQGKLYLAHAGTGEFGTLDVAAGRFEPICQCPGMPVCLDFLGDWAIVGISTAWRMCEFTGLPLSDRLKKHKINPRCGAIFVNLKTGDIDHMMTFTDSVREITGLAVLPGCSGAVACPQDAAELAKVTVIESARPATSS